MLSNPRTVRVYIAEEQQFLREAYTSFLSSSENLVVVGDSGETHGESLMEAAALRPEVMIVGTQALQVRTVEHLSMLHSTAPSVGIVLLSFFYDMNGIGALRKFSRQSTVGCAYLLKHTVATVGQLAQVVQAVAEGRIILDRTAMEELVTSADFRSGFLSSLSPREMEVLTLMAESYRNNAIALIMHLGPKTVERHINSIYSKLGGIPKSTRPRAHVIGLFRSATGQHQQPMMPLKKEYMDNGTTVESTAWTTSVRAPVGSR